MTRSSEGRLILLPGLGADERMYEPQFAAFPHARVLPWLEPRCGEALVDYAGRMASQVDSSEPQFLAGASFGGPVALEMARRLNARAVFLIGSFRSPSSIPLHFRCAARLASLTPVALVRAAHGLTPHFTFMFGALDAVQHAMMAGMLRASDPRFIRWGGAALARWPGTSDDGDLPFPVHQIHGDADRIIPVRRVRPDVVVPGAGHLLNVTHADAVNRFMQERMTGASASSS